jgi:hypothetical protein
MKKNRESNRQRSIETKLLSYIRFDRVFLFTGYRLVIVWSVLFTGTTKEEKVPRK